MIGAYSVGEGYYNQFGHLTLASDDVKHKVASGGAYYSNYSIEFLEFFNGYTDPHYFRVTDIVEEVGISHEIIGDLRLIGTNEHGLVYLFEVFDTEGKGDRESGVLAIKEYTNDETYDETYLVKYIKGVNLFDTNELIFRKSFG